tara:strand:+ start:4263 stop:4619 length:357 start_codon:yes stop_codon:yes gene_type:complete
MNNVKEFLSKLDEVVWTEDVRTDECIKGILRDGSSLVDVEVTLRSCINNMSGNRTMPFNLTMYVNIDGSMVSFWGCEDIEAQLVMTEWFLKRGVEAHRFEMTLKDNSKNKAQALFNSL